jgi:hypothetical protein
MCKLYFTITIDEDSKIIMLMNIQRRLYLDNDVFPVIPEGTIISHLGKEEHVFIENNYLRDGKNKQSCPADFNNKLFCKS